MKKKGKNYIYINLHNTHFIFHTGSYNLKLHVISICFIYIIINYISTTFRLAQHHIATYNFINVLIIFDKLYNDCIVF